MRCLFGEEQPEAKMHFFKCMFSETQTKKARHKDGLFRFKLVPVIGLEPTLYR